MQTMNQRDQWANKPRRRKAVRAIHRLDQRRHERDDVIDRVSHACHALQEAGVVLDPPRNRDRDGRAAACRFARDSSARCLRGLAARVALEVKPVEMASVRGKQMGWQPGGTGFAKPQICHCLRPIRDLKRRNFSTKAKPLTNQHLTMVFLADPQITNQVGG